MSQQVTKTVWVNMFYNPFAEVVDALGGLDVTIPPGGIDGRTSSDRSERLVAQARGRARGPADQHAITRMGRGDRGDGLCGGDDARQKERRAGANAQQCYGDS